MTVSVGLIFTLLVVLREPNPHAKGSAISLQCGVVDFTSGWAVSCTSNESGGIVSDTIAFGSGSSVPQNIPATVTGAGTGGF